MASRGPRPFWLGLVAIGVAVGLGACSSSSSDGPGSGGATSSGGHGSGGATSSGGSSGSGGSSSSGGATASGGSSSTGGSVGSGGSSSSGGTTASGGSSSSGGASASGGTTGSGGATSSGGASAGGGGGGPGGGRAGGSGVPAGGRSGGNAGRGGAAATGGAAGGSSGGGGSGAGGAGGGKTSAGCGSASPLKSGNFTESIDGTTRKWVLDVPTGYEPTKPYRLIFVWHPLGGSASQVVSGGYNGLKAMASNSTIFATADGLQGSNGEASGVGWWNVNNGDMKLVQIMIDKINAGLCVDQDRVFSTDFSFGGMMSYTLGYEFNVFRAVAPCSGDLQVIPHKDTYTGPLPIMAFHGNNDTFVDTSRGRAARDKYLTRNKCGTQTKAVDPSPCVQYQDCTVPTIWCEFPGAHEPWSQEPQAIWKFFSQF